MFVIAFPSQSMLYLELFEGIRFVLICVPCELCSSSTIVQ